MSYNAKQLAVTPQSSNTEKAVCMSVAVLETKKEIRKVLPEEQYVDNLEKIIVRDYFPELPKLKAQSEYLEAVARNDYGKVRELQVRYSTRRLTDRRTSPSARPSSPSVFDPDTPCTSHARAELSPYANTDGDNDEILEKKKKKESALDNLTVQSYLDKYTSEDNASFEELAALHNKRERIRNAWMYEAEEKHNESLVYRGPKPISAADEQLIAIKSGEVDKPPALDNWTYKARNAVLFDVDEAPLTMAEYVERAKQNEKIINKEATRLDTSFSQRPQQNVMARAALQQASSKAGHVDVTGKEIQLSNSSNLELLATPSPAPGIEDSPMMTWGEIDGTPFRLDGSDIISSLNAPTFKIPELPVRERIAQDIADQIVQRNHAKRKQAIDQIQKISPRTPFISPRSSDRLALMSPAAHRLATDKLGIRIGTNKLKLTSPLTGNRTPHASRLYSPALYNMVKVKKEVPSNPGTPSSFKNQAMSSITDNLLNLPPSPISRSLSEEKVEVPQKKRAAAADFF